jgi:hypothetical protein
MEESAQLDGTVGPERRRELFLRSCPSVDTRPKPSCAGLGQPHLLAAAISLSSLDGDQAVSFQRQKVPSEGRPVHDEVCGKGVDRHRPQPAQLCEDRKLRRAQPARRQKLIVKLGDVPGSLACGEAVAVFGSREAVDGGIGSHLDVYAYTPIYAHML